MAAWDEFDRPEGGRTAEELRRIVRYQRWLVAVVLGQLALWLGFIALGLLGAGFGGDAINFPAVLTLILGGVGGVFVFLTAWELRGAFAAVAFGLMTVVPCMGLMIIVLVNDYAPTALKTPGGPGGTCGASRPDIAARPPLYDHSEDAGW